MSQDLLSFFAEDEAAGKSGITLHQTNAVPGQIASGTTESMKIHRRFSGNATEADTASQNAEIAGPSLVDNANDEDDDFGDFENAAPAPKPAPAPGTTQLKQNSTKPKPPVKEVRSPFAPKATQTPKPSLSTKSQPPKKESEVGSHPFAGRMDLLFEADGDDYDAGTDELGDLSNNPEAAMEYSKRIIAEQNESAKGKGKGKTAAGQRGGFVDLEEVKDGSGVGNRRPRDPNVLFDADDVSDGGGNEQEDDFGDFETWDAPVVTASAQTRQDVEPLRSGMDLLALDDVPPFQPAPKSAETRSLPQGSQSRQVNGTSKATVSASSIQQQDDDFWEDFETPTSAPKQQQQPSSKPQQDDTWPDFDTTTNSPSAKPTSQTSKSPAKQPDQLPPTNIPPPTTLLTLYPPLFTSATETLLHPLSKLDLASRQTLLAHPATHQFLRGYLSSLNVLARIIAGRKLRWKRDQRLSQSMRIGPAAAGGAKGGMKLAGLDKSEVAKEDREVLDTIRLYRTQIGKLRSAVTAASAAPGLPKLPAVPEIQDTMPVKALKQADGGITAREACALCGLRREERVVKVDDGVEDSFGEWWVQGLGMHVQCREFWEGNEGKLKSR